MISFLTRVSSVMLQLSEGHPWQLANMMCQTLIQSIRFKVFLVSFISSIVTSSFRDSVQSVFALGPL